MSKEKKNELLGAVAWSVIEGGLEANASAGWFPFPYEAMPVLPDVLPPLDDLIVPASGLVPVVAGSLMNKPSVEDFGRGATVYGVGSWMVTLTRRLLGKMEPLSYQPTPTITPAPMQFSAPAPARPANQGYGKYTPVAGKTSNTLTNSGMGKYGNTSPLAPAPINAWTYRPR